jgi:hypothetical protein
MTIWYTIMLVLGIAGYLLCTKQNLSFYQTEEFIFKLSISLVVISIFNGITALFTIHCKSPFGCTFMMFMQFIHMAVVIAWCVKVLQHWTTDTQHKRLTYAQLFIVTVVDFYIISVWSQLRSYYKQQRDQHSRTAERINVFQPQAVHPYNQTRYA